MSAEPRSRGQRRRDTEHRLAHDKDVRLVPLPSAPCRAGTRGARYGELADIAWYRHNALGAVHEAGRKAPNAWGFHHMPGNVWEWCWNFLDPEVSGSYRYCVAAGGATSTGAAVLQCGAAAAQPSRSTTWVFASLDLPDASRTGAARR
jgi:formylglycine-generating enzyme required for sulfatase activity